MQYHVRPHGGLHSKLHVCIYNLTGLERCLVQSKTSTSAEKVLVAMMKGL